MEMQIPMFDPSQSDYDKARNIYRKKFRMNAPEMEFTLKNYRKIYDAIDLDAPIGSKRYKELFDEEDTEDGE